MGAVCGRGGFMMRGPIKGAVFLLLRSAGAGLSHIVSKDSRVDFFPLIVYGMAELSADYSSRFTEMARSPAPGREPA